MQKVMMILGLVCLTSPAFANKCKVMISGDDVVYMIQEDTDLRNMTYREMFDRMHDSEKPAGEILRIVNSARIGHKVSEKKIARISELGSVPTREKRDPKCKDKSITGYECRDKQLRDAFGATEGIDTPVQIAIRKSNRSAIRDLAHAFKCDLYKPTTAKAAVKAPEQKAEDDSSVASNDSAPANEPAADLEAAAARGSQVAQLAARPRGVGPNENAQPRVTEVHPRAEDVVGTGVAPSARITVEASRTVR